jgi:PhzF family phenazine biosynthesis protein
MFVDVQLVNAFVDEGRGGNPAGVVIDADGLSAEQKLAVAAKVGHSETAFVSSSKVATYKLEFFTPTRQIAHCGHATVAAFSLMAHLGLLADGIHSKETIDGNRKVILAGGWAFMEQVKPTYRAIPKGTPLRERFLYSLGLDEAHLLAGAEPWVVDTGNSFLIVPLANEAVVAGVRMEQKEIEAVSDELDLIGYYIFSLEAKRPGRHAGSRMFAPRYGIQEEAGTGMAAGPLACFLRDKLSVNETVFQIEQGWLMPKPSPSLIEVDLSIENGEISGLMAGGAAKTMSTVRIEI